MQGIKLKDFQINTVNKLLDATSMVVKRSTITSPYCSGKTIILLSYIEEYLKRK